MATTNDNLGTNTGTGSPFLCTPGADLTQAAGVVTVSEGFHYFAGTGNITTINWTTSPAPTEAVVFFARKTGATCLLAAGGNISGTIPTLTDDAVLVGVFDGTNWRFSSVTTAAFTGILGVAKGGTGVSLAATGGTSNVLQQTTVGGNISVAALAAADIPALPASKITSGTLALAQGGTGATLAATGGANQVLKQTSAGGAVTVAALAAGDVPDVALTSNVPLKNAANTFSAEQTLSGRNNPIGITPVTMGASGGNYPSVGYNVVFTASGGVQNYRASDTAFLLDFGGTTAFNFKYAAAGVAGNPIAFTSAMSISSSGGITATGLITANGGITVNNSAQFNNGLIAVSGIAASSGSINAAAGTVIANLGFSERGRSALLGEWTNVAYAAGNFTASGAMTWTVTAAQQITYGYTLIGKTMVLRFLISPSTTGGTASTDLRIAVPAGFSAVGTSQLTYAYFDGTAWAIGHAITSATYITLRRVDNGATNWPLSAGIDVRGVLTFEVA